LKRPSRPLRLRVPSGKTSTPPPRERWSITERNAEIPTPSLSSGRAFIPLKAIPIGAGLKRVLLAMYASGRFRLVPAITGSRKLEWFTASKKPPLSGTFSTPWRVGRNKHQQKNPATARLRK
jgi:hypothetical protein